MMIGPMFGAYQELARELSWCELNEYKVEESSCSGFSSGCTSRLC